MDLQITYSAQYGLEWRVVLPERPVAPRASSSHDFRLPDGACNTWSALWHGLEALETDLHHHIHLENNVLFPRLAVA